MGDEIKIIEDKATPIIKEWEDYARKGNWTVKGYQVVRGISGPEVLGKGQEEEYMVVYRPHGVLYHHSYGLVSKFFKGLIDGKLYGAKCPKCETVYCPPRAHCWNPACKVERTQWIDLPLRGVVHTFSVMLFSADAFFGASSLCSWLRAGRRGAYGSPHSDSYSSHERVHRSEG